MINQKLWTFERNLIGIIFYENGSKTKVIDRMPINSLIGKSAVSPAPNQKNFSETTLEIVLRQLT